MTRDKAVLVATAAAGTVWQLTAPDGAGRAFDWCDCLGRQVRPSHLAAWLEGNGGATAEALYRHFTAREPAARHWRDAPPALRVAVEAFRATYLVLRRESETAPGPRAALEVAWDREQELGGRPAPRQRR